MKPIPAALCVLLCWAAAPLALHAISASARAEWEQRMGEPYSPLLLLQHLVTNPVK